MINNGCIFWDIASCSLLKANRSLGGTYRLHRQGRRLSQARTLIWHCEKLKSYVASINLHYLHLRNWDEGLLALITADLTTTLMHSNSTFNIWSNIKIMRFRHRVYSYLWVSYAVQRLSRPRVCRLTCKTTNCKTFSFFFKVFSFLKCFSIALLVSDYMTIIRF